MTMTMQGKKSYGMDDPGGKIHVALGFQTACRKSGPYKSTWITIPADVVADIKENHPQQLCRICFKKTAAKTNHEG